MKKKKTSRQKQEYREGNANVRKTCDGARSVSVSQVSKEIHDKKRKRPTERKRTRKREEARERKRESVPDTEMVQCPTGYAPRLFWPGSHFYGFMGTERNLWRPVYSGAQRATSTFASWVAAASPLVTKPTRHPRSSSFAPSFSVFSLPLSLLLPPSDCSSYFPKFCVQPAAATPAGWFPPGRRQLFPPSAPGTMVTPSFVSDAGFDAADAARVAPVQS